MTSGATSARAADPCCFVIFGASGDLTHRLLIPALYNLAAGGLLPEGFSLIGISPCAQSQIAWSPQRASDLPHRSLSRQGNSPEYPRAALRQRIVRADLEPGPHRSRPDHGGRDVDGRAPRSIL